MASSKNTAIFGTLAIVFAVLGFFGIRAWIYQPKEIPVQSVNDEVWQYSITTPGKGWFDTGMWVLPNKSIVAGGPKQPFTLAVDDTQNEAFLGHSGTFIASVATYPKEVPATDVAKVINQGKIYFWTDRPLTIFFKIDELNQTDKNKFETMRKDAHYSDEESPLWLKISGVTFVCLFVLFMIWKIRATESAGKSASKRRR